MYALSCCMIVKNEAQSLGPLLKSLFALCEQVVVVDTGSADNTVEIARDFGADVGFFPWNDSFADARNRSLQMARQPWILYLDADDFLPAPTVRKVADLKNTQPERAYGFTIKSTQDGVTGAAGVQVRMFPNQRGLRFRYRVHEQIRPALMESGIPISFVDAEIIHRGYTDRETIEAKQARNLRLLLKDLEDFPMDGFLHYMSGMAFLDLRQKERAVEELNKAWGLCAADSEKVHIAQGASLELAEMGLGKTAEELAGAMCWLKRAEEIDPNHPRFLYLRARFHYEAGNLEEALKAFEKLTRIEICEMLLPVDLPMMKSAASAQMAQILIRTGRPMEAIAEIEKAQKRLKRHRKREDS